MNSPRRRVVIPLSYSILILLMVVSGISLWLNLRLAAHHHAELAIRMGRSLLQSIIATRQWNAEHGGFYLPVSDVIRPNPYLKDLQRDIETKEGVKLTKVNPAYMTRLLADELRKGQDVMIHITGLEPMNPGNRPDPWEERALTKLAAGAREVWAVEPARDGRVFRLMAPLRSDAACFRCHEMTESRRPGMVLGGISVSFPYATFERALTVERSRIVLVHSLFFLLTTAVLVIFSRVNGDLKREIAERTRAEEESRQANAELERRVLERTAALESANRELETFNYSVSHDLRSPLTSIDGFSRVLLEDYGERLDEKARGYLNRVITASRRMNTLIESLLALSRLGREEMRREPVDLSTLAATVADELHFRYPERKVAVTIARGVMVRGDRLLLRVVMENLFSNAWKYTGKREEGVIEFGQREVAGEMVCFVRDNGTGFDMARAHRLFAPFERLHGRDEFEGSGIGLATVRRILERHGGEIWAEAEEGKGATFFFTLWR